MTNSCDLMIDFFSISIFLACLALLSYWMIPKTSSWKLNLAKISANYGFHAQAFSSPSGSSLKAVGLRQLR
jgi:hypothetical protein